MPLPEFPIITMNLNLRGLPLNLSAVDRHKANALAGASYAAGLANLMSFTSWQKVFGDVGNDPMIEVNPDSLEEFEDALFITGSLIKALCEGVFGEVGALSESYEKVIDELKPRVQNPVQVAAKYPNG